MNDILRQAHIAIDPKLIGCDKAVALEGGLDTGPAEEAHAVEKQPIRNAQEIAV